MLKRLLVAALLCVVALSARADANNRITAYYGAQPSSALLNTGGRFQRLADGTLMQTLFGQGGGYAGLSVSPSTGLYVTVGPTTSPGIGAVYQFEADDASAWGGGPLSSTTSLAADPTQIVVQATLSAATPNIGPLSVPGTSGQSQISLIECKVITADATPTATTFFTQLGAYTTQTVNATRNDTVSCQAKAGTAGTSPSVPAVDSGWIAVGYVTVPYGTATLNSGMVTAEPQVTANLATTIAGSITPSLLGAPSTQAQATFSGPYPIAATDGFFNQTGPVQNAQIDYGAVPDGITNDTTALQNWLTALSPTKPGYIPCGTYVFTSPLSKTSGNNITIAGNDNPYCVILLYGGTNTTNDLITFGNSSTPSYGWHVSNMKVDSSTLMTGGAAIHIHNMGRSRFLAVTPGGADGNKTLYNGIYFDGVDQVEYNHIDVDTTNEGIQVDGINGGLQADLTIGTGRVLGCHVGLHMGGAFGGLYIKGTQFIANFTHFLEDQGLVAIANREVFSTGAIYDSTVGSSTHLTTGGPGFELADPGSNETVNSTGDWFASSYAGQPNILISSSEGANNSVTLTGDTIYNAGGDAGASNGIEDDDASAQVNVTGGVCRDNGGWCAYASTTSTGLMVTGTQMYGNGSGNVNQVSYTNYYTHALFPTGVASSPIPAQASQVLDMEDANWNGTASVIEDHYLRIFAGTLQYVNSSFSNLLTIDPSGNVTSAGSLTSGTNVVVSGLLKAPTSNNLLLNTTTAGYAIYAHYNDGSTGGFCSYDGGTINHVCMTVTALDFSSSGNGGSVKAANLTAPASNNLLLNTTTAGYGVYSHYGDSSTAGFSSFDGGSANYANLKYNQLQFAAGASGPIYYYGSGAPTGACNVASYYLRSDSGASAGAEAYVCRNISGTGTWEALGGG